MNIDALREILRTEYGIETYEQLEEAIRNQPKIDIGLFCAPLPKTGRKPGKQKVSGND